MAVPVESVAVGKCYLTEIGQVRRVLEIKEAMVNTESRRKDSARRASWGALTTVSILRFDRGTGAMLSHLPASEYLTQVNARTR
jgi:hypothetical protein